MLSRVNRRLKRLTRRKPSPPVAEEPQNTPSEALTAPLSATDLPPALLGVHGAQHHYTARPVLDPDELADPNAPNRAPGRALPAFCQHVLTTPHGRAQCSVECPGWQRDGSCLLDIVRERGEVPRWEIDRDGYWVVADPQPPTRTLLLRPIRDRDG